MSKIGEYILEQQEAEEAAEAKEYLEQIEAQTKGKENGNKVNERAPQRTSEDACLRTIWHRENIAHGDDAAF